MQTSEPQLRRARLAVCLFTHNGRRDVLAKALASIFGQIDTPATSDVQVCLTDNASHDGTEELVARLVDTHGERLRYLRHERDRGLSQNLLSCVELADSDYCWILTSDDAIEDGGIARVLELIAQANEPPGIVVGKANFDFTLTQLASQGAAEFYPAEQQRTVQYQDADSFLTDCGMLTSLVSTLIVNRDSWRAALTELGGNAQANKTIFPHLPIMATMARRDPRWVWCPAKLVRVRMDNAFLAHDEGWSTEQIHARLLSDMSAMWSRQPEVSRHVRLALMRRAYWTFVTPGTLLITAPEGRSVRRRVALMRMYVPLFWWLPAFWIKTAPFLAWRGRRRVAGQASRPNPALAVEHRVARIRARNAPREVPNSHEVEIHLDIANGAPVTLFPDAPRRVVVGYRWYDKEGALSLQGPPLELPERIKPGSEIACGIRVLTPSEPGTYELHVALAQEDVGWFDDRSPELACRLAVEVRRYGWYEPPISW